MEWYDDLKEQLWGYVKFAIFVILVVTLGISWVYAIFSGICNSEKAKNKFSFIRDLCNFLEKSKNNPILFIIIRVLDIISFNYTLGGGYVGKYLMKVIFLLQIIAIPFVIWIDDSTEPGLSTETMIYVAVMSVLIVIHILCRVAHFIGKYVWINATVDLAKKEIPWYMSPFVSNIILIVLSTLIIVSMCVPRLHITDEVSSSSKWGIVIMFVILCIISILANNLDRLIQWFVTGRIQSTELSRRIRNAIRPSGREQRAPPIRGGGVRRRRA